MPRAALLKSLRLLIALAVMLSASTLRYAGPTSDAAGLAQAADHGSHGHNHSHDDDVAQGDPLFAHGHEHQDHSHVALGLAPPPASLMAVSARKLLRLRGECRGTSDPPYRLDRPPCLLSLA